MKIEVLRHSRWEHPSKFPTFAKGIPVTISEVEDKDFLGWYACEIDGHKTYVPKIFVCDGKLTKDYNPTELIQDIGDVLEVEEIIGAWLLATTDKEVTGWIPAECVKSVNS